MAFDATTAKIKLDGMPTGVLFLAGQHCDDDVEKLAQKIVVLSESDRPAAGRLVRAVAAKLELAVYQLVDED